ncbi:diguanylate cyclase domain-containing protein [Dactylosporangium sp. McL0621]|uniref:diguanylate cyclase domain-containing protein n=1 Tax=Dactylosporangium sp. McL0621 TaxID=3415678 RepID=UPI003CE7585E
MARAVAYLRRDLLRTMRLVFASALAAVTAVSFVQVGLLRFAPAAALPGTVVVVAAAALGLRTLLRRLHQQHRAQAALLHAVLQRLPSPVLMTGPEGAVLLANPAAVDLLGGDTGLAGLATFDGRPVNLPELARSGAEACEARLTRPGGSTTDIRIEAVPIEGGAGIVWALQDVSAQRVYEESLHHTAYHDALTGLPNRALLWQHLSAAAADGRPYAVLLVDLDDFKTVNDTHGHQAGDELLSVVGHRLRDAAFAGTRTAPQRAVVPGSAATSSRCCCRARTPRRPTGWPRRCGPFSTGRSRRARAAWPCGRASRCRPRCSPTPRG